MKADIPLIGRILFATWAISEQWQRHGTASAHMTTIGSRRVVAESNWTSRSPRPRVRTHATPGSTGLQGNLSHDLLQI